MKKVNWNTMLLTACLTVGGWAGVEVYKEIRATHDSVLILDHKMVSYDIALTDLKTRLAAVEIEIEKLKYKIKTP